MTQSVNVEEIGEGHQVIESRGHSVVLLPGHGDLALLSVVKFISAT